MAKTAAEKKSAEAEAKRDLDSLRLTPARRAAALKAIDTKKTRRSA